MAPPASSPPPSFALSVRDDHRKDEESKCAYLMFPFLNCPRTFSSNADSVVENDDGGGDSDKGYDGRDVSGESCADPAEVERVCKVIDELFALDRNMEAVLDECGVRLSHDLVVDMLQRFKHASRRSGSFVGLGRGLGLIMILELITA
ncbi:Pentatricopeptide repeat-containing protein, mitochondrial [Glycine soja]|uniref:Pentatricopeptide repeat-containing protein, mitochondrial n=1 Tax=Glycine soja TaxID=3848 RepID=A0A0B2R9K0_GLYSO|nr:Pentatricopeptide repeat-containing protein, mitochondrial [Glycine soja]